MTSARLIRDHDTATRQLLMAVADQVGFRVAGQQAMREDVLREFPERAAFEVFTELNPQLEQHRNGALCFHTEIPPPFDASLHERPNRGLTAQRRRGTWKMSKQMFRRIRGKRIDGKLTKYSKLRFTDSKHLKRPTNGFR